MQTLKTEGRDEGMISGRESFISMYIDYTCVMPDIGQHRVYYTYPTSTHLKSESMDNLPIREWGVLRSDEMHGGVHRI